MDYEPGRPIDHRSDEQQRRAAIKPEGDFELSAARVVARLTSARVVLQDDNSQHAMPDIRIDYVDGRAGYVEVVTDLKGRYAARYQELRNLGFRLSAPDLQHTWFVWLSSKAWLNHIRPRLLNLLQSIATSELLNTPVTPANLGESASAEVPELQKLGVTRLCRLPIDHTVGGLVYLLPEGTGGPWQADLEAFQGNLKQVLRSSRLDDVRVKLTHAGGAERHIFLGTSWTTPWAINHLLSDSHDELPHDPPALPPGITHLWVWRYVPPGRCLHWSPTQGWLDPAHHWRTP
jgi:hypothetical protein